MGFGNHWHNLESLTEMHPAQCVTLHNLFREILFIDCSCTCVYVCFECMYICYPADAVTYLITDYF